VPAGGVAAEDPVAVRVGGGEVVAGRGGKLAHGLVQGGGSANSVFPRLTVTTSSVTVTSFQARVHRSPIGCSGLRVRRAAEGRRARPAGPDVVASAICTWQLVELLVGDRRRHRQVLEECRHVALSDPGHSAVGSPHRLQRPGDRDQLFGVAAFAGGLQKIDELPPQQRRVATILLSVAGSQIGLKLPFSVNQSSKLSRTTAAACCRTPRVSSPSTGLARPSWAACTHKYLRLEMSLDASAHCAST
jgi:hypothetical protein